MAKAPTRAMKFVSAFGTPAKFAKATGVAIKAGPKLDPAVRRALVDSVPRPPRVRKVADPSFEAKHPRKPAGTEEGGEFASKYTVTTGPGGKRIFTMKR